MFIDATKSDYLKYFKLIEPKLEPGTVIIRASMEKNDGMSISYKIK